MILTGIVTDICGSRALLRAGSIIVPAVIGAAGIQPFKREGDGATPIGTMPIRQIFYRSDRIAIPTTTLPKEALAPEDGWCDDVNHALYNRRVKLPFESHHERLWRDDNIYDLLAVLGWNDDPVNAGRGSAIFLHVASSDERPTKGCIAVKLEKLRMILAEGLNQITVTA